MVEDLANIEDPILRYTLFFQIIKFLLKGGVNMCIKANEEKLEEKQDELVDLSEDTSADKKKKERKVQREINNTVKVQKDLKFLDKNLTDYLEGFNKWISQPMYSPDHPFGKVVVKNLKESFDSGIIQQMGNSQINEQQTNTVCC